MFDSLPSENCRFCALKSCQNLKTQVPRMTPILITMNIDIPCVMYPFLCGFHGKMSSCHTPLVDIKYSPLRHPTWITSFLSLLIAKVLNNCHKLYHRLNSFPMQSCLGKEEAFYYQSSKIYILRECSYSKCKKVYFKVAYSQLNSLIFVQLA